MKEECHQNKIIHGLQSTASNTAVAVVQSSCKGIAAGSVLLRAALAYFMAS